MVTFGENYLQELKNIPSEALIGNGIGGHTTNSNGGEQSDEEADFTAGTGQGSPKVKEIFSKIGETSKEDVTPLDMQMRSSYDNDFRAEQKVVTGILKKK